MVRSLNESLQTINWPNWDLCGSNCNRLLSGMEDRKYWKQEHVIIFICSREKNTIEPKVQVKDGEAWWAISQAQTDLHVLRVLWVFLVLWVLLIPGRLRRQHQLVFLIKNSFKRAAKGSLWLPPLGPSSCGCWYFPSQRATFQTRRRLDLQFYFNLLYLIWKKASLWACRGSFSPRYYWRRDSCRFPSSVPPAFRLPPGKQKRKQNFWCRSSLTAETECRCSVAGNASTGFRRLLLTWWRATDAPPWWRRMSTPLTQIPNYTAHFLFIYSAQLSASPLQQILRLVGGAHTHIFVILYFHTRRRSLAVNSLGPELKTPLLSASSRKFVGSCTVFSFAALIITFKLAGRIKLVCQVFLRFLACHPSAHSASTVLHCFN